MRRSGARQPRLPAVASWLAAAPAALTPSATGRPLAVLADGDSRGPSHRQRALPAGPVLGASAHGGRRQQGPRAASVSVPVLRPRGSHPAVCAAGTRARGARRARAGAHGGGAALVRRAAKGLQLLGSPLSISLSLSPHLCPFPPLSGLIPPLAHGAGERGAHDHTPCTGGRDLSWLSRHLPTRCFPGIHTPP